MATTPKTHLEKSIAGEVEPITHLEKVIAEYGGGGGGGGESTIAWKPTVAPDGTISWERTSSTTKPEDQNIKGDKGDKGTDGVSPVITGSKVGKTTTLTIVDADHPSGAPLATINDGEDNAADVDTVAKELIEATGSGFCPGDFDIGSISISTVSGWTYYDNFPSRVRTKEGTTIHLKVGDVIGFTSYENARFYLGWRDGEGVYRARAWMTSDFIVTQEGDYVILLAHLVDTTLVNKNELLDLFFIRRKVAARKSAYDLPCFYAGRMRLHAHQGIYSTVRGSDLIPQGLNAFEEAGKKRAFICEADIQQTADGYLVCIHNTTVDATTDGTGAVADLTLAEIRALRLKRNDGTISDQQVPTIDEYLEICKKYGMIAVPELKPVRTAGFTAKVAAKVSEYGMEGQTILATQVANAATYVRSVTDLPLMMIVLDSNWDASFAYAQANDNIIFTFAKTATTDLQEKINACHAIGVPCEVHVVNQKSEAEAYFDMGADIINTDILTESDWLEAYATEQYVNEGLAGKADTSSVLALQNSLESVRTEAEGTQAELTEFKADYAIDMAGKQTMAVINWQYEFFFADLLEMLKCGGAVIEWGDQTYMPVVGFEDKVVEGVRTINAFVHATASIEGVSLLWFTWTVAEADRETVKMSPDSSFHEVTAVGVPWVAAQLSYKQDTLVSGTNIKTVNGLSLLGSGNIQISGGSGSLPQGGYKGQALVKQSTADGDAVWGTPQFDAYLNENSTNAVQNKVVAADIKTRAIGWIDRKILTYFTTNEGEEQSLPTTAGQIIEVESGIGIYRATLTQADIDGINAATATAGHIVRVYYEYDETDFYDVEIKNTGSGKGYYGLDTGNPDPDYRYPNIPGNVLTETVYQIDERLIPGNRTVDQTYDATSANAQSGTAVAEAVATKQDKIAYVIDGDWRYKINPDNTFEAYYSKTGVTLTITDTSGNFYRSAAQTLTLPTGITGSYDATPLHASVNASHNNYPCFGALASVATNQIKYYALSGGSRTGSPNYIVTAHVFGTLAAKA